MISYSLFVLKRSAQAQLESKLIGDGTATLRVLRSAAQWHGVTYKEDKPALMAAIEKMIAEGKYPRNLWA